MLLLLQVIELKALRDLAADLYSYNTMSIEAEEVQAKMAALRRQHNVLTPSGEALHASESLADGASASSAAQESALLLEQSQDRSTLVPAFTGSQLFQDGSSSSPNTAQQEQDELQQVQDSTPGRPESSGPETGVDVGEAESSAHEIDESDQEVARLAAAMWEDGEDATGPDSQMGCRGSQTAQRLACQGAGGPGACQQQPCQGLEWVAETGCTA